MSLIWNKHIHTHTYIYIYIYMCVCMQCFSSCQQWSDARFNFISKTIFFIYWWFIYLILYLNLVLVVSLITSVWILFYADDICLFGSIPSGLQKLLKICNDFGKANSIYFNPLKSVYMVFLSIDFKLFLMLNSMILKPSSDLMQSTSVMIIIS